MLFVSGVQQNESDIHTHISTLLGINWEVGIDTYTLLYIK